MIELSSMDPGHHFEVAKSLRSMDTEIEKWAGDFSFRLSPETSNTWNVNVEVWCRGNFHQKSCADFDCPVKARAYFHEQVSSSAREAEW